MIRACIAINKVYFTLNVTIFEVMASISIKYGVLITYKSTFIEERFVSVYSCRQCWCTNIWVLLMHNNIREKENWKIGKLWMVVVWFVHVKVHLESYASHDHVRWWWSECSTTTCSGVVSKAYYCMSATFSL